MMEHLMRLSLFFVFYFSLCEKLDLLLPTYHNTFHRSVLRCVHHYPFSLPRLVMQDKGSETSTIDYGDVDIRSISMRKPESQ